jgi:hypothetical protein
MIFFMAIAILCCDFFIYKTHLRPTTGMKYDKYSTCKKRVAIKLCGLYFTLSLIILFYGIFSEYENEFYSEFFDLLKKIIIPFCILAIPYFFFVDGYQISPKDGYWHIGNIILFRWSKVYLPEVAAHLRGWLVKAFFLPLMFSYLLNSFQETITFNPSDEINFFHIYTFTFIVFIFFDLCIATIGYIATFRPLDTHIRTVEPSTLGWLVAIICYFPFWDYISQSYLNYETDWAWGAWAWNSPLLYGIWGTSILICLAVYIFSTAQFGCRFSNLTHRGVITNGPYRWTKHPAYISKNISWWLIAIPFIPEDGDFLNSAQNCILLSIINGIYYLRAKTEERHLSWDPTYVNYARWIEKNGIFRWVPDISWVEPGKGSLDNRSEAL